jgi:uncharacterized protein YcbX
VSGVLRLSAIFIYPVKACRGISVPGADVGPRGFEGDRRWMIVDGADEFVTQRERPELALVGTRLAGDAIELAAAGLPPLAVPRRHDVGPARTVRVWRHWGRAVEHRAGSEWFTRLLGGAHRLVYMPDDHLRRVNPDRAGRDHFVGFADGYPFLIVSRASLDDLNARLAAPVEIERFRPNLVVEGAAPYAEDDWAELRIGRLRFRGVKRCDRCSVTTVDPRTGVRGHEPLRTLATYRKQDGKVWFGMNLVHEEMGPLAVGDSVVPGEPSPQRR